MAGHSVQRLKYLQEKHIVVGVFKMLFASLKVRACFHYVERRAELQWFHQACHSGARVAATHQNRECEHDRKQLGRETNSRT